jgi:hypothetical protein
VLNCSRLTLFAQMFGSKEDEDADDEDNESYDDTSYSKRRSSKRMRRGPNGSRPSYTATDSGDDDVDDQEGKSEVEFQKDEAPKSPSSKKVISSLAAVAAAASASHAVVLASMSQSSNQPTSAAASSSQELFDSNDLFSLANDLIANDGYSDSIELSKQH